MKIKLLLLFPVLTLMSTTYAQDDKSFTGYYRASGPEHLLLEEDHSFYIIAYATFIKGEWIKEKNELKLIPHNPEHTFEVYARFNPNIKEGYKIKFNNFYKKQTYIATGGVDTMQPIFNPNPNCFNNPYVNQFSSKTDSISFVDAFAGPESGERKTYTFTAGKYNDFIALYNDPTNYHREISLPIEQMSGKLVLKNSAGQYDKYKPDKKLQQEIEEIREMAKKEKSANEIYCNPSYRPFDITAIGFEANYSFNSAKNAWISILNYEKDEEIYPERLNDAYHSIGILYKYEKITPVNIALKQFKINGKSLFTATCNDQE